MIIMFLMDSTSVLIIRNIINMFTTESKHCIFKFIILEHEKALLTLRGLSLFFKILSISNNGDSIAYILATVHFLYLIISSFSDMEYYFYQLAYRYSKGPKCFVGLNQMQCSSSFDWNWGKQNDPTACWHQLHPWFQVLQQGKCLHLLLLKPQIAWAVRGTASFEPQLTGGHPL